MIFPLTFPWKYKTFSFRELAFDTVPFYHIFFHNTHYRHPIPHLFCELSLEPGYITHFTDKTTLNFDKRLAVSGWQTFMGVCCLAAIAGVTILIHVLCHVGKSLYLIWRGCILRWNLWVLHIQISCSDIKIWHQYSSPVDTWVISYTLISENADSTDKNTRSRAIIYI